MFEVNRILLQLNKAVECANSPFPQENSLAIILLDNIIELQLYKRAEREFFYDCSGWNSNRKYKLKKRESIIGKSGRYNKLLKFSRKNNLITNDEQEMLKNAHEYRNAVYHKGYFDKHKTDLILLVYYGFLEDKLIKWGALGGSFIGVGFMKLPGFEFMEFTSTTIKKNYTIFNYEDYYEDSVNIILNKLKFKNDLFSIATQLIDEQISDIKKYTNCIKEGIKYFPYFFSKYFYLQSEFCCPNSSIKKKFKHIDVILLVYAFVREYKDKLEDIEDPRERGKTGRYLFNAFKRKHAGVYPNWVKLERTREKILNLKEKDNSIVFKAILEIEAKLFNLLLDTQSAAMDLDAFINDDGN